MGDAMITGIEINYCLNALMKVDECGCALCEFIGTMKCEEICAKVEQLL